MHSYPGDITREEFEIIRPALENAKKFTRAREKDLYDIFCAILYLIKSGCQWRMLPADFPKWGSVGIIMTCGHGNAHRAVPYLGKS
jgi:transposase